MRRLVHVGPAPSATCSALPRPTRPASAAALPTELNGDRPAHRRQGPRIRRQHGTSPALRLVSTPCLTRRVVKTCGIDGIALTKLDILDGFPEIKVCVACRLDGLDDRPFPASMAAQARVEPVYETIEGWSGTTGGARFWADLPPRRSSMSAHRGVDRSSGRAALHESGTRRHDSRSQSIPGLTREIWNGLNPAWPITIHFWLKAVSGLPGFHRGDPPRDLRTRAQGVSASCGRSSADPRRHRPREFRARRAGRRPSGRGNRRQAAAASVAASPETSAPGGGSNAGRPSPPAALKACRRRRRA